MPSHDHGHGVHLRQQTIRESIFGGITDARREVGEKRPLDNSPIGHGGFQRRSMFATKPDDELFATPRPVTLVRPGINLGVVHP